MKYISTRGQVEPVGFEDAVLMGLADDGGLLIPETIPDVSDRLSDWRGLGYADLAIAVMGEFVDDIPAEEFAGIVRRTYADAFPADVAPLVQVGDAWVLELWHGPTLAFKDVALQLLGNLFEAALARRGGRLNVLGATSGDTGSAAIYGCRGRSGIEVFMMHPAEGVSEIQRRQMTTVLDENIHNIAVRGTFDDCQRIMKTIAADVEFKRRHAIGAVNSVNWARVLAQIVYYVWAALRLGERTGSAQVQFAVPTGNFGDILAGWYAMKMGVPIDRLILATNENDILCRFFQTGEYSLGEVHKTLSPSMDIQVASNFERYLYYRLGEDPRKLSQTMADFGRTGKLAVPTGEDGTVDGDFRAGRGDTEATLATIGRVWREQEYLLDPHSAVGVHVGLACRDAGKPLVCLATAHPAKFPDAIRTATSEDLAHHPKIDHLHELPTRCAVLDSDVQAVREFVEETLG